MKKTKIQTDIDMFSSNQQYVMNMLGINKYEYCKTIMSVGEDFLEDNFPKDNPGYTKHYKRLSLDLLFWCWWNAEWKLQEAVMLDIIKATSRFRVSKKWWKKEMERMAYGPDINNSFYHNYVKKK